VADEIKDAIGVESKKVKGSGGVFDVVVDGRKIFSKHEVYRFPNPGEIAELLKESSGG
jgi:selT/selW/selH-like putative selenoprotein